MEALLPIAKAAVGTPDLGTAVTIHLPKVFPSNGSVQMAHITAVCAKVSRSLLVSFWVIIKISVVGNAGTPSGVRCQDTLIGR